MEKSKPTILLSDSKIVKVTTTFVKVKSTIASKNRVSRRTLDKAAEAARQVIATGQLPANLVDSLRQSITKLEQVDIKIGGLLRQIKSTLNQIRKYNAQVRDVELQSFEERQGMNERFRPILRKLQHQKLRKQSNKELAIAISSGSVSEQKQVKRIIEKKAAQHAHKLAKKQDQQTNKLRHSQRRAISYSIEFVETAVYNYMALKHNTHWKKVYDVKGNLMLRAKRPYMTLEEALKAAEKYAMFVNEDPANLSAYKCRQCGKYHFGHTPEALKTTAV